MSTHGVDYAIMYAALDDKRQSLGLSWRKVAVQTDVPSGLFGRMKVGLHCSDDNFVSLLVWLGVDEPFLKTYPAVETLEA